jgi:pyruvate kinase
MASQQTTIAATLGPSCREVPTLRAMIQAGAHCFRMNFSQGTLHDHQQALDSLRQAAAAQGQAVTVMGDLCGPRFRIGRIEPKGQPLTPGQEVAIAPDCELGTATCFGTNDRRILADVAPEDRIFINEGRIQLRVLRRASDAVHCRVIKGGVLFSHRGLNLPDTAVSIPPLTDVDRTCIAWAREHRLDALLMSFIRAPQDVTLLRRTLGQQAGGLQLVAKVETLQATQHLEALATVSDQLLIARGDLGVEVGQAQVPRLQKQITRIGHQAGKPVILATHILHSMIDHPEPTRAEVSDVANAVFDGVDTLLLTGETAIGCHPVQAVSTLREIVDAATGGG